MKAVVQRIKRAAVTADGQPSGTAGAGLLVLLGVYEGDDDSNAELLASKVALLRVFCDENDKMNRSVLDIGGSVLTVSRFVPIPKRATARLILMQWHRQRLKDFICILSTALKSAV